MALMPEAAGAVVFGARNAEQAIGLRADIGRRHTEEAGPAGAAVELGRGRKERQRAAGADESTFAVLLQQQVQRAHAARCIGAEAGAVDDGLHQLPEARVSISEGLSTQMQEWLVDGRLDIAVLYNPSQMAGIAHTPLVQEALWLVQPRLSIAWLKRPSMLK